MSWKNLFPKNNRYFETDNIILYYADTSELISKFLNCSVDIIITDPPYGIGYEKYDNSEVFYKLEKEYYRILKPNSWFIFWWTIKKIPEITKLKFFEYKWMIICLFHSTYSKCILGDRTYTPIFVYAKGNPKVMYKRTDCLLADELPIVQSKIKADDFKPTFALTQLLLMFTKEKSIVLDPFMGFGSLGLVCELFNRNYIGIENNKERIEIAKRIISEGKIIKPIPEYLNTFYFDKQKSLKNKYFSYNLFNELNQQKLNNLK